VCSAVLITLNKFEVYLGNDVTNLLYLTSTEVSDRVSVSNGLALLIVEKNALVGFEFPPVKVSGVRGRAQMLNTLSWSLLFELFDGLMILNDASVFGKPDRIDVVVVIEEVVERLSDAAYGRSFVKFAVLFSNISLCGNTGATVEAFNPLYVLKFHTICKNNP